MSTLSRWAISYLVALVVFTVVDGVWIALVASGLYRTELGPLLASEFQPIAAAVFYLGYVAGLVHFGLQPLSTDVPLRRRVLAGALFGLFTYGTWALTALAVLNGFSALVAITDIGWGVILGALETWLSALILRRLRVVA